MKKFFLSCLTSLLILFNLVACSSIDIPDNKQTEIEKPKPSNEATDETKDQPDNKEESTVDAQSESEPTESQTKEIASRLYYYDIEKDQIYYIDQSVEVINGAYINALTNALKGNQGNKDFVSVNENTFVTSAKFDEKSGILSIHFNESFYLSTNLGSGIEAGFIDALVNTYGYNYDLEKVAIYVEDKLYEDQRGPMPNGYFPVTTDNAIEY